MNSKQIFAFALGVALGYYVLPKVMSRVAVAV